MKKDTKDMNKHSWKRKYKCSDHMERCKVSQGIVTRSPNENDHMPFPVKWSEI